MQKTMNDLLEDFKTNLKRRRLQAQAEADAKVIEKCLNGDLKSFEELVRRYMSTAMRISMGYLRNPVSNGGQPPSMVGGVLVDTKPGSAKPAMLICKRCKNENLPDSIFCDQCGTALR